MPKKLELKSRKINKLTIIKEAGKDKSGNILWLCQCDCGKQKIIQGRNIKNESIKSCGCYSIEQKRKRATTHGLCKHPLWLVWNSMKQRCNNKNNQAYKNYGGRNIKVCKRWLKFKNFFNDMVGEYSKGMEIDRRNVNGDYEPLNCRWLSHKLQQRNKTNNHYVTIYGKRLLLIEWAECTGLKANTILTRIRRNWPNSRLLEVANKSLLELANPEAKCQVKDI